MAGYTRQSTFADGDTITAALFNNEYNQLVNAFSNTSGHAHDGTAANGPVIGLIGDAGETTPLNKILIDTANNYIEFYVDVSSSSVQQLYIADGAIVPVTDNDIDLGTSSLEFKDLYLDGTANLDSLVLGSGSTVTAILDEDDLSSDSATSLATQQSIKAYVDAQVTAQDLDFQGDSGGALSIDLDSESLTIAGGTGIDTSGATNTLTVAIDSTVATLTGSQTLTNKTLDVDNNTVSNIEVDNFKASAIVLESEGIGSNDNDTSLPTSAAVKDYVDTQLTAEDLDFQGDSGGALSIDLDSETLTIAGGTGIDTSGATNTLTVAIDSTVATLTGSQTLTNKTLTTPVISSISNTGTLTLPTSTDTLVGRATTDTLTNKTLDADNNTLSNIEVDNFKASAIVLESEGIGSNDNDTTLPTSAAVKDYVDTQITAEDLDVSDGSSSIAIDLDSETLGILGGTGLTSSASGNNVTLSVDAAQTQITSVGTLADLTVTGEITANGGIALGDSDKATFGASDDLEIYHDGNNSYIKDGGVGDLRIWADNPNIATAAGNKIFFGNSGAAELYFTGGALRLATTSTGIDVTGTATMDGLTVDGDATFDTSTLKVDSSNNRVGIGTASPDTLIEAEGTGSLPLFLSRQQSTAGVGVGLGFRQYDSTNALHNYASIFGVIEDNTSGAEDGSLTFHTSLSGSLSERMRIDENGNVGIGTDNPNEILEVSQNQNPHIRFNNEDTSVVANDIFGTLEWYTNDGSSSGTGIAAEIRAYADVDFIGSTRSTNIDFLTASGTTAPTTRMTIQHDGNVGIGTTSPRALLDIGGSESSSAVGDGNLVVKTTTTNDSAIVIQENSGTEQFALGVNVDGDFVVTNSGTTVPFIIQDSGNVGIGTTSPSLKLEVSGNASGYITRFINDGGLADRAGLQVRAGADSGAGTTVYFRADDGDGDFTGELKTVSGVFQLNDVSDERLKQDIVDTSINGLEAVNNMRIVDFAYKKNPTETIQAGFIAQELQQVFAPAVSESTEYEESAESYLGVSRERLVPVLVKAIQEQQEQIESLKSEIELLKGGN